MSKVIIKNESNLNNSDAVVRVFSTINAGLISKGSNGEQYCFATRYEDVLVTARKTKNGTHVFTIFNNGQQNNS